MNTYVYNFHEERGEARLWVYNPITGADVWQETITGNEEEDGMSIFEAGYMRNAEDVAGLEKYLKSIGAIEKDSTVVAEEDYQDEKEVEEDDDFINESKQMKKRLNETSHEITGSKYIINYKDQDIVTAIKELFKKYDGFTYKKIQAVGDTQFYNVNVSADVEDDYKDLEAKRFLISQKVHKFRAEFFADLSSIFPVVNINMGAYQFSKNGDKIDFVLTILMSNTNQREWVSGEYKQKDKKLGQKIIDAIEKRDLTEGALHNSVGFSMGEPKIPGEDENPIGIYGSNGMYYLTYSNDGYTVPSNTVSHWIGRPNQFKNKPEAEAALKLMKLRIRRNTPHASIKEAYVSSKDCPRCGTAMTQGASHTGSGLQWECHNCGKVMNESHLKENAWSDSSSEYKEGYLSGLNLTSTEADCPFIGEMKDDWVKGWKDGREDSHIATMEAEYEKQYADVDSDAYYAREMGLVESNEVEKNKVISLYKVRDNDDRVGGDPSSKQYFDRVIKSEKKSLNNKLKTLLEQADWKDYVEIKVKDASEAKDKLAKIKGVKSSNIVTMDTVRAGFDNRVTNATALAKAVNGTVKK